MTATAPVHTTCERCGRPVDPDQEWCLECGGARTLIHRPPDWRVAAAIVATVVALVLAGFAVALVNASSNANRAANTTTLTTTAAGTTPTANTTTTSASRLPPRPAIHGWPTGQTGYTVQLDAFGTLLAARTKARQLLAAGLHPGVLSSSRHPAMTPGRFIVFIGHFPTQTAAQARAAALGVRGYPSATPVLVATPVP